MFRELLVERTVPDTYISFVLNIGAYSHNELQLLPGMLVFKIFVCSTFSFNAPWSITKFITFFARTWLFIRTFRTSCCVSNIKYLPIANRDGLLTRTPSMQSVLRKLVVMGYIPQLLNLYTLLTHICVFPIYLEFEKLGILHEKCVHIQRQEDFPWIEEEMEISFVCK